MMHSSTLRIVGAILILIALAAYLFSGPLAPTQPPPAVHSTIPGAQPSPSKAP